MGQKSERTQINFRGFTTQVRGEFLSLQCGSAEVTFFPQSRSRRNEISVKSSQ